MIVPDSCLLSWQSTVEQEIVFLKIWREILNLREPNPSLELMKPYSLWEVYMKKQKHYER